MSPVWNPLSSQRGNVWEIRPATMAAPGLRIPKVTTTVIQIRPISG